MTDDERRQTEERRRVERGGRRSADKLSLTPEMRAQAADYAATIQRCLETLTAALEDGDLVAARGASRVLKDAADALRRLLATGSASSG